MFTRPTAGNGLNIFTLKNGHDAQGVDSFWFLTFMNMQKTLFALALSFALLFAAAPVKAQIFYGGVGVIGTSNAVIQNAFVIQTNFAFVSLAARTLQIPYVYTNTTATVAYGAVFSGFGLTNYTILITNQFSFPASNGWLNGQTFTTNIAPLVFSVPITPLGSITFQTNGATSYSNNVIFQ